MSKSPRSGVITTYRKSSSGYSSSRRAAAVQKSSSPYGTGITSKKAISSICTKSKSKTKDKENIGNTGTLALKSLSQTGKLKARGRTQDEQNNFVGPMFGSFGLNSSAAVFYGNTLGSTQGTNNPQQAFF